MRHSIRLFHRHPRNVIGRDLDVRSGLFRRRVPPGALNPCQPDAHRRCLPGVQSQRRREVRATVPPRPDPRSPPSRPPRSRTST